MRINPFFLSVFALGSLSLFAVGEETGWTLDWSTGEVGKAATSEISPYVRFSSRSKDQSHFKIVGAEGSPSNPFSHLEKALVMQRSVDDKAPVVTFVLPGKTGYGKGSFEFDFFLPPEENAKADGLRFGLRVMNPEGKPKGTGSFRLSPGGVTFQATAESPIIKSRAKMKLGATNTVKIEWDFDTQSGFTVFLNGNPVTLVGEEAGTTFFPISAAEVRGGVRDLVVYPRANVSLFIGKVTASAK